MLARGQEPDLAELEESTRRALVLAGDSTMGLDVAKAEAYYRQALDLCPAGTPGVLGCWPAPPGRRSRSAGWPRRPAATRRRSTASPPRETSLDRVRR